MITITVNEHTKEGKVLLQTARLLAETSNNITFTKAKEEELLDDILLAKMKKNTKGQYLSKEEKQEFLNELKDNGVNDI